MVQKKKLLIISSVLVIILLLSISFVPSFANCPQGRPSICGLITNTFFIVGGAVTLQNELKSKILPGVSVQIELDNGEIHQGKLTRKAVQGRPISSGDKVRLNCQKAYASPENPNNKICELEFSGFDPNSACVKGSPCYGKIPSWSINVDAKGSPDPELLKLN